ncbi:unnamed protein product [Chrysoparadoxa australica]
MPVDTELHKAAHNGELGKSSKCAELIESGEIEVNAPGAAERRALHRAAGGNHLDIMEYLLEKGAPLNQADKSGRTALHWASISGHAEATKLLLSKDCDMMAITSSGATALSAAAEGGRVEVVRLILEKATEAGTLQDLCNIKDASEKSAFDLGATGGHCAYLPHSPSYLSNGLACDYPLFLAYQSVAHSLCPFAGHKVVCKLLKDMGDPNAQSAACVIS